MSIATIDVTGAYLEAVMPEEQKVFMSLNPKLSNILCELDRRYGEYVGSDGKIVVELKRALYGCLQSSLLWYQTLSEFLLRQGFRRCNYDSCLFIKQEGSNEVLVCVHVDDLLIAASNNALLVMKGMRIWMTGGWVAATRI
jgi:hypothetical protein